MMIWSILSLSRPSIPALFVLRPMRDRGGEDWNSTIPSDDAEFAAEPICKESPEAAMLHVGKTFKINFYLLLILINLKVSN